MQSFEKLSESPTLIYNFSFDGNDGNLESWLQQMISAGVGSAVMLNAG